MDSRLWPAMFLDNVTRRCTMLLMSERTHVWEDIIDDEIRQLITKYSPQGLKDRPALLCIDNYNAAFGDRPEPLLDAIKRFPSSCGLYAWNTIEPTQRLMRSARQAGVPVIHTTVDVDQLSSGVEATKFHLPNSELEWNWTTFDQLAPAPGELLIRKPRATAFQGCALPSHLVQLEVNTIILCGNSTSGCVRATAVDAFSAGYRVAVVEECVFDRNWLSHKVNLLDLHCKYADVIFLEDALEYLNRVGTHALVAAAV
jgi:maleamate amidohydrolase